MNTENRTKLLNQIDEKFEAINQKTDTHLEGMIWAKPITYWDYIQTVNDNIKKYGIYFVMLLMSQQQSIFYFKTHS